jgi:hypothetical protein
MYLGLEMLRGTIRQDDGSLVDVELKTAMQVAREMGYKHETQVAFLYSKVDDNGVSKVDYTRMEVGFSNRVLIIVNDKYLECLKERISLISRKESRKKEAMMKSRRKR